MSDWKILVVEDDPDGQEFVSRILRHHRINFDVAPDGESAVDMLQSNTYTLVVIDLALPKLDGWQLLSMIKNSPLAETPCIAVTAYHSAEVAVKAIQAGFAAYFPKPLDATSFVRELSGIVAQQ